MKEHRSLIQLHEQVWMYPQHPDFNRLEPVIGVITTPTRTVLIDSGNGPLHAQGLEAELKRIGAPPVETVILTHHHWDHVFGTSHFNATVIGHEAGYGHLKRYSAMNWQEYIAEQLKLNPNALSQKAKLEAIDDFDAFQVKAPVLTFTDQLVLHLDGGMTLQLKHVGGHHAEDSIMIKAVEANLVFVGDAFYPPPSSRREEGEGYSPEVLKKMITEEADLYIHGHGEPVRLDRLYRFLRQVEA